WPTGSRPPPRGSTASLWLTSTCGSPSRSPTLPTWKMLDRYRGEGYMIPQKKGHNLDQTTVSPARHRPSFLRRGSAAIRSDRRRSSRAHRGQGGKADPGGRCGRERPRRATGDWHRDRPEGRLPDRSPGTGPWLPDEGLVA